MVSLLNSYVIFFSLVMFDYIILLNVRDFSNCLREIPIPKLESSVGFCCRCV